MGCHHSKVNEQVKDTTAPVAEPSDLMIHTMAETVEVVTEVKAAEEEVVPVAAEEAAEAVVEEVKVEEATIEAVAVEGVKVEETVAKVAVIEVGKEEAEVAAVEVPKEEAVAEKPKEEVVVEATEEVAEVAEVAGEAAVVEPETEEKPIEEVAEVKGAISFERAGVTFGERHVAFYMFKSTDKEDPAKEITLSKRYNDFKALHTAVAKLMASESNVPADATDKFQTYPALPALPKAGLGSFVKGRRNQGLTDEREVQFQNILNAIARHPIAFQSTEFQAFLA